MNRTVLLGVCFQSCLAGGKLGVTAEGVTAKRVERKCILANMGRGFRCWQRGNIYYGGSSYSLVPVHRLVFLHEGVVVWEGSVDEFEISEVPIVKQFRTGSLKGPIEYV